MTSTGVLQIVVYIAVILLMVRPLGSYMARVFQRERTVLDPLLTPVERFLYRCAGVKPEEEMGWAANAGAMLLFNGLGVLMLYALQRLQHLLPFNPRHAAGVLPDSAFNTAVSFATNTNWQGYAGETAMSYCTQMVGLTVQNFLSAATGMAVLALVIRGFARHSTRMLGNFWVDLTRSILYILLPGAVILAVVLVGEGVIQNLDPPVTADALSPEQIIPGGPVASQVAIKQIGTNGGGFFGTNSAHPFENPTPLSGFLEALAILLIPAALCYTFGVMVRDTRQGWALLASMMLVFTLAVGTTLYAEGRGTPVAAAPGADRLAEDLQAGGNMEGKEVRFGIAGSALWATATTAASNGSVNSMHASFTPLGATVMFTMMQVGEVVFGGVGSGLYGMLVFVIVAVFVAGLLVGRTPEYLGHKLEPFQMKMASLAILIMPVTVLSLTAAAVLLDAGTAAVLNPGPRGFSEVLYAFTSMGNNNGSAFAGLRADTPFYNIAGGIAMLIGRYWLAIPTLALAGSLARGRRVSAGGGTLPTHTPLFIVWLTVIILLVGALSFFPALAQADVAVAMNTGTQSAREAANMVDLDSNPTKLLEIVEIGKQLLMTRGALATFSIANDVAKYFAIIPAAFVTTYPALDALNIMRLTSPESAVLFAVIFNALVILALVPLALRGVRYAPLGAMNLLRRHLLLYGGGGLLSPFIGIKLIDVILAATGLA